MKQTCLLMGMPITIEVVEPTVTQDDLDKVFAYFVSVDDTFSTYKATSEISKINRGELLAAQYSENMKSILALSEQTKKDTHGYFDIQRDGIYDPSGIVKGWAVQNAANMLRAWGFRNFYIDAGGDIQLSGNKDGNPWRIGIRNPFNRTE
ncbi:MAG TPA: FAD:protein FMN transferase, partial [Ktedonobacter sp.]|nr:FAD:protein FMN transferase [Ktedonobacter sp.]